MHQWVLFRSYFDGWRWEERDEEHRIVRESRCGFTNPDDALADLRLLLRDEPHEALRRVG